MDSKTFTINNKLLFEFNKTYFENNDNLLSSKFPNLQFDVNESNINTLDKLIIPSNIVLNNNYHLAVNTSYYLISLVTYLKNNNIIIPFFEIDDFEVFDNNILFTNIDKLININEINNLNLDEIKNSKLIFLSNNEINNLQTFLKEQNILNNLNIKSLSYVLLYILNKNIKLKNGINIIQAYKSLEFINGTKLYYFLEKTKENNIRILNYI